MREKEYSLGFLLLRAVITILIVAAILLGLRAAGITATEENVPLPVVEENYHPVSAEQ